MENGISMMESQSITANPLELTLDEVIALNKVRNQQKEEKEEEKGLASFTKTFRPRNGIVAHSTPSTHTSIDQRLRSIPGFGSRPIHKRLGYYNNLVKRNQFLTPTRLKALQSINKAKLNTFRKLGPIRRTFRFTNPNTFKRPLPLTQSTMHKFNSLHHNAGVGRGPASSSRSVVSMRSNTVVMRHSIRASLNQAIQDAIEETAMIAPQVDTALLEDFQPTPRSTHLTINTRFSTYP